MRVFLYLFCLLLATFDLYAFTAILKSGKKIEGTLVAQDGTAMRLKGNDGIVLTLKKDALDLPAMVSLNGQPKEAPAAEHSSAKPTSRPRSLAEIAKEAQLKRTGTAKVLTKQDIPNLPEITVIGTEKQPTIGQSPAHDKLPPKVSREGRKPIAIWQDEAYWRAEAQRLKEKVDDLRRQQQEMDTRCAKTGGPGSVEIITEYENESWDSSGYSLAWQHWPEPWSYARPNSWCAKAENLKTKADASEEEQYQFELQAKRYGVPAVWFRY